MGESLEGTRKKKNKIERSWEVLSEKGSERVLEPWGAGVLGARVLESILVL